MSYLLDTNTVIYLINDRLATTLPPGRYGIPVITETTGRAVSCKIDQGKPAGMRVPGSRR